jgi:hypothetical protein
MEAWCYSQYLASVVSTAFEAPLEVTPIAVQNQLQCLLHSVGT